MNMIGKGQIQGAEERDSLSQVAFIANQFGIVAKLNKRSHFLSLHLVTIFLQHSLLYCRIISSISSIKLQEKLEA